MKKRIASLVLSTSLVIATLAGCGGGSSDPNDLSSLSKNELISQYEALESNYNDMASELEQVKITAQALTEDGKVNAAISSIGDGTGRFTFNSTDSKIIFPTSFAYPNSSAIVPDGKINITSSVSVSPSSTWISRINGSALELEQSTNGISGNIKVNETIEQISVDQLQSEVLEPWFENIASSTVKYTDIFINSSSFGKQAETPIMIDSENAYLICGMAAYGSYSITYIFVYRGSQDTTKDELIKNILNTIAIDGNLCVIQN